MVNEVNKDRNLRIIDSLNFLDRRISWKIHIATAIISLIIIIISINILTINSLNSYYLALIVILLIPGTLVHEFLHYIFQWIFSHKKPYLGFKFPFPFSALSPNASITRNQAIIVALSPAFIMTTIITIPAIFIHLLPKIILLTWAFIELTTCYGDFYQVNWLRKYPIDVRLKNVNLVNVLYKGVNS
jgi:hypothetical protein